MTHLSDELKICLTNPSFGFLTAVAQELARNGTLASYVTAFVDRGGRVAKEIGRTPFVGRKLSSEFARREAPADIPEHLIINAATALELSRAALGLLPQIPFVDIEALQFNLMWKRNFRIGRVATGQLETSNVLFGSYGTVLEAFLDSRSTDILKLVDYPIAHHRFTESILKQERERDPAFSVLGNSRPLPEDLMIRLDRECSAADAILAPSSYVMRSLVAHGVNPKKVVTVPFGIDTKRFSPQPTRALGQRFKVLFVGQLTQRKGLRYLLDGFSKVTTDGTELTIVGSVGNDTSPLRPYAHLFNHLPFTSHGTLPDLYRSASVLVFPSLVEGLGLVVLEAMAAGLPVIVTACGPDQVVRDGVDGFIIPTNDSEAIADRLTLLRSDPGLRKRMGESARQRAEEFSRERYVESVKQTIAQLRSAV